MVSEAIKRIYAIVLKDQPDLISSESDGNTVEINAWAVEDKRFNAILEPYDSVIINDEFAYSWSLEHLKKQIYKQLMVPEKMLLHPALGADLGFLGLGENNGIQDDKRNIPIEIKEKS